MLLSVRTAGRRVVNSQGPVRLEKNQNRKWGPDAVTSLKVQRGLSNWVFHMSSPPFYALKSLRPMDCSHETPQSLGFPRQEYRSGLPSPSPGDLPDSGIQPGSPALQADSLPSQPPGRPLCPEWPPQSMAAPRDQGRGSPGEGTGEGQVREELALFFIFLKDLKNSKELHDKYTNWVQAKSRVLSEVFCESNKY